MSMSADDNDLFGVTDEDKAAALSILEPPRDFDSLTRRAQLNFERKRIAKLQ